MRVFSGVTRSLSLSRARSPICDDDDDDDSYYTGTSKRRV